MEKKENFVPIWRRNYNFYMVYMEEIFSKMFCTILTKIKGVSIFVSIPHCPMDYCIPAYSTVFFFFFFFCFFLLNKALLVIVWNNLNSNSVEY